MTEKPKRYFASIFAGAAGTTGDTLLENVGKTTDSLPFIEEGVISSPTLVGETRGYRLTPASPLYPPY
jgi:hypothetical protein